MARRLGATFTINALTTDPIAGVKKEIGGAHWRSGDRSFGRLSRRRSAWYAVEAQWC